MLGLRAPAGPPQGGEQSPLGGDAAGLAPGCSGGPYPPLQNPSVDVNRPTRKSFAV